MSMAIDGSNGITFPNTSTQIYGATGAASQTWQNVLASRALATTYTNSTTAPITVSVNAGGGASQPFSLIVNGVTIAFGQFSSGTGIVFSQLTAIIPIGATYQVTGTYLNTWAELR